MTADLASHTTTFLSLSDELILAASILLNLQDLDSLNQTCRRLRRITIDAYTDAAHNSGTAAIFVVKGGLNEERSQFLHSKLCNQSSPYWYDTSHNRNESMLCCHRQPPGPCPQRVWTCCAVRKAAYPARKPKRFAIETLDLALQSIALKLQRNDGLVSYTGSSKIATITVHDTALTSDLDCNVPGQRIVTNVAIKWVSELLQWHKPSACEIIWPVGAANDLLSLPDLPESLEHLTIRNMAPLPLERIRLNQAVKAGEIRKMVAYMRNLHTLNIETGSYSSQDLKKLRSWLRKVRVTIREVHRNMLRNRRRQVDRDVRL